jgi:hypothetical protein
MPGGRGLLTGLFTLFGFLGSQGYPARSFGRRVGAPTNSFTAPSADRGRSGRSARAGEGRSLFTPTSKKTQKNALCDWYHIFYLRAALLCSQRREVGGCDGKVDSGVEAVLRHRQGVLFRFGVLCVRPLIQNKPTREASPGHNSLGPFRYWSKT